MSNPRNTLIAATVAIIVATAGTPLLAQEREGPAKREGEVKGPVTGLTSSGSSSRVVSVPAGELTDALESLAKQTGVDLIYPSKELRGLKTKGLQGNLQTQAAFEKLLEGTQLVVKEQGNSLLITTKNRTTSLASANDGKLRLAQAEGQNTNSVESTESKEINQDSPKSPDSQESELKEFDTKGIPEILVTGTKAVDSFNADIERTANDTQPYVVLTREAIQRSGAQDISQLLKNRLPMNSSIQFNDRSSTSIQGNATNINLRGLGANQTLILIDGRRAASYALSGRAEQPDLNGIPLSAIERIEVLPASASGIYGGSATGGVVNIVLRRDYAGTEARLTYGDTFRSDASRRQVDLTSGLVFGGGRSRLMIAGTYSDANPLTVGDREFQIKGREKILANNPGAYLGASAPPLGATTNICSVNLFGYCSATNPIFGLGDPTPLTLKEGGSLGQSITYVPSGYAGLSSDNGAAFLANAGQYNLELANTAQSDGGAKRSLLNAPTVKAIRASLRQILTPTMSGFIEVSASQNIGSYQQNISIGSFVIPESAPNNPFQQAIRVTTPTFGGDREIASKLEDGKLIAGLIFELPKEWHGAIDLTWDRTRLSGSSPSSGADFLSAADVADGTIDILRDTELFPVDFGAFNRSTVHLIPVKTTLKEVSFRAAGALAHLPAGELTLSALVQTNKQMVGEFNISNPPTEVLYPSRSQAASSAYVEARVPLFSEIKNLRGMQLLELQIAGRFDQYKTNGANLVIVADGELQNPIERRVNRFTSFVPTFGVRLKPIRSLMLRASLAKGFLPPAVNQLVPNQPVEFQDGLTDPRRGNQVIGSYIYKSGGNPKLEPETSDSISVGAVITPEFVPGLRVSMDWVKTKKKDNIRSLGFPASIIELEQFFPGAITRAAPTGDGFDVGPITSINGQLLNSAKARVEAIDWSLSYEHDAGRLGSVSFIAAASRQIHNEVQVNPLSPVLESATLQSAPSWNANASFTWGRGPVLVGWSSRYWDSYWFNVLHTVVPNQRTAQAPSALYHDLFASYRVESTRIGSLFSVFDQSEIQLSINNVLNKKPQPLVPALGADYYDQRADPRLANYSLTFRKNFGGK